MRMGYVNYKGVKRVELLGQDGEGMMDEGDEE